MVFSGGIPALPPSVLAAPVPPCALVPPRLGLPAAAAFAPLAPNRLVPAIPGNQIRLESSRAARHACSSTISTTISRPLPICSPPFHLSPSTPHSAPHSRTWHGRLTASWRANCLHENVKPEADQIRCRSEMRRRVKGRRTALIRIVGLGCFHCILRALCGRWRKRRDPRLFQGGRAGQQPYMQ